MFSERRRFFVHIFTCVFEKVNKVMITTLEKTKLYLGINTAMHDALINELIGGSQSFMETFCNRKFEQADYVEEEHTGGKREVQIHNYPLVELNALTDANGGTYSDDDYTINSRNGCIRLKSGRFPEGLGMVKITYKGGYTEDHMPSDLLVTLWQLVGLAFEQRKSQGKSQERVNSSEIVWERLLTETQKKTLLKYKRIFV